MFKSKKILFTGVITLAILAITGIVFAQTQELTDPLGGKEIPEIVNNIIKSVMGIIGVLALVMFIYGGLLWMTSGGNPEKIKKGRGAIVWAVLGMAFIFFSYAALAFILGVLME
ncbi:hypothetical protein ISS06_01220 [Patescibacteria group bacterium]|nr:hypothetical protein [Patescibacteria group bacterium]